MPGYYNITLTNTSTVDNVISLNLNFASIETNYVSLRIIGTPTYVGGDRIWEFENSTASELKFRPYENSPDDYLRPSEFAILRAQQPTNHTGFSQANATVGTQATGDMYDSFDAPDYSIPEPAAGYLLGAALLALALRRKLFRK